MSKKYPSIDKLYAYFQKHGRFFYSNAKKVYLLYKNELYEISDNPRFNKLLLKCGFNIVC